jgi:hypothetical protein
MLRHARLQVSIIAGPALRTIHRTQPSPGVACSIETREHGRPRVLRPYPHAKRAGATHGEYVRKWIQLRAAIAQGIELVSRIAVEAMLGRNRVESYACEISARLIRGVGPVLPRVVVSMMLGSRAVVPMQRYGRSRPFSFPLLVPECPGQVDRGMKQGKRVEGVTRDDGAKAGAGRSRAELGEMRRRAAARMEQKQRDSGWLRKVRAKLRRLKADDPDVYPLY